MSKFFTPLSGLGMAFGSALLAWGMMTAASPVPLPSTGKDLSDLPAPLTPGRYAALEKSPFTLATASQENADFAKDLVLAGYLRIDGQDFVLVANRTSPDRLMIGIQPSPGDQGMLLVKIERDPSGDPTKMRARIRKGTQEATLKYENPALTGVAPVSPAATGNPPAVPGQAAPAAKPPSPPSPAPAVIRRRIVPISPAR